MLKKYRFFLALLLAGYPIISFSQMQWFKSERNKPEDVKTAKIVFNGEVNAENTVDLMSALDDLNNTYPSLKEIELYINSYGGDVGNGYMGYQVVKVSRVPVKTINTGITASAATLIYCGGYQRLMMPEASFILHPAKSANIQVGYVSPSEVELLKKFTRMGSGYLSGIYSSCTNIRDEQVQKMLYSDENTWFVDATQAKQIALVRDVRAGIKATAVSYYITDSEKKS